MSDTNRTKVGWVKEAAYGVVPNNPAFKNLRIKGSNLTIDPKTKESAELRTDRMISDVIRIADEAGGTVPLEVSWLSLDDLFEFALQNLWQRTPVRDNNGVADSAITDVAAGTGVYTIAAAAAPATDYSSGTPAIGHLVRTTGFGSPANNGLFRVSAVAGLLITTSNAASVAEAAPAAAARLKVVGFRGAAGDITAAAGGLGSTTLDFTTLGLAVGQWVKIGGATAIEQFATAGNSTFARITAIAAHVLSLDNLPAGWGVDAGAAKTITVSIGDYIRNGITEMSMSVEQQYPDLAIPEYDYLSGMVPDLMIGMKSNDIIEATATFIGADGVNLAARVAGASDVAAATNDVLSTGASIGIIADNGAALTGDAAVTSLDMTLTNGIRRRPALGSLASTGIGSGAFRCSGKMSMYYASNLIRTKIIGGVASSFMTRIVDSTAPVNKRCYLIDMPKIKYTVGNPNNPGIDTDRTMDPEFVALASPTFGYAFHMQRIEEYYP